MLPSLAGPEENFLLNIVSQSTFVQIFNVTEVSHLRETWGFKESLRYSDLFEFLLAR